MVTGTLGLAYPATAAALRQAAAAARASPGGHCRLLVDVNWRPVFWPDPEAAKPVIREYLRLAHVVKLSDADLLALYGVELEAALLNPCRVADLLPGAEGVLVTAGGEGAAYCFRSAKGNSESRTAFVPPFKGVNVVDTTGAGDAFTAGFILRMLQAGGLDALMAKPAALKEAAVFASACGALTCTRPGAIEGQPSLEECERLFETSKSWQNYW